MGKDINNEREIKFRAKAINDDFFKGEWVYGYYTKELWSGNLLGVITDGANDIPIQVVGLLSSFNNPSPKDTVYLDFEGNEGDVWEEEVQNLVYSNEDKP